MTLLSIATLNSAANVLTRGCKLISCIKMRRHAIIILSSMYLLTFPVNAQSLIRLPAFHTYARDCHASKIYIEDEQTIVLEGYTFDGRAPAGHFIVSNATSLEKEYVDARPFIVVVPENWRCEKLGPYSKETVRLKFPAGTKVQSYKYLSTYCVRFMHNFCYTYVNVTGMPVPEPSKESKLLRCDRAAGMMDFKVFPLFISSLCYFVGSS